MKGVLFLSSEGHCRARMAEALARRLVRPDVPVFGVALRSASPSPGAAAAMAELGLDLETLPLRGLTDVPLDRIGLVIALGRVAADAATKLPLPARERWDLPEPAGDEGAGGDLPSMRALRDALLERMRELSRRLAPEPAVGVVGGSGFYDLPGLSDLEQVHVETPFGPPSDALTVGQLAGRRVVFLARHGRQHALLPGEVNARANIYALKRLGVTRVISVSAVGSLREEISPGDVVLPAQFIDRTSGRPGTFFGDGAVAHVSLADPVCASLSRTLRSAGEKAQARVHAGGTYLCIEGPQFSTRAESRLWRSWGADVVGMTNLPEARLAREAEICYASLTLPTDYDCWRDPTDEVRVSDVLSVLRANVERARQIVARAVESLDVAEGCTCRAVLDTALFTPPAAMSPRTQLRLHPILARRLQSIAR